MVHSLKIREEYFCAVNNGNKTFEVRKYDRDFRVGDCLALNEIDNNGEYTGRHLVVRITYILADKEYCKPGYVIMGLALGPTQSDKKRGEKPDIPLIGYQDESADIKAQAERRIPVTKEQMERIVSLCMYNSCDKCMLGPLGCNWVMGKPRESIMRVFEIKED